MNIINSKFCSTTFIGNIMQICFIVNLLQFLLFYIYSITILLQVLTCLLQTFCIFAIDDSSISFERSCCSSETACCNIYMAKSNISKTFKSTHCCMIAWFVVNYHRFLVNLHEWLDIACHLSVKIFTSGFSATKR